MSGRRPIGIDLGTTFSTIAMVTDHDRGVEYIADPQGRREIPSMVCLKPKGEWSVGFYAKKMLSKSPLRTVYDTKRMLGCAYDLQEIQEHRKCWRFKTLPGPKGEIEIMLPGPSGTEVAYSPVEIHSKILKHLKELTDKRNPSPIRDVVIGVPANFGELQKDQTMEAAQQAGLRVLDLIDEPKAAAIAYSFDTIDHVGKTILIFDFGGGTLDVAVLEMKLNEMRVLSRQAEPYLGGRDFDEMLVDYCVQRFDDQFHSNLRSRPRVMAKLQKKAEMAKIQLTTEESALIEIEDGDDNNLEETISRAKFEEICQPLFERSIVPVMAAIKDARKAPQQINHVILVGGTSQIPRIKQILKERLEANVYHGVDPRLAVAKGAALWAAKIQKSGQIPDFSFYDAVPVSIGICTGGDVIDVLISKGTPIPPNQPITRTHKYQIPSTNCSDITLEIYGGESLLEENCKKIATFALEGLPKVEGGTLELEVTFTLNDQRQLTATAKLLNQQNMTTTLSVNKNLNPYTASEMKKMFANWDDPQKKDEDQRIAEQRKLKFKMSVLEENLTIFFMEQRESALYKKWIGPETEDEIMEKVTEHRQRLTVTSNEVQALITFCRNKLSKFFNHQQKKGFPLWLAQ